MDNLTHTLVGWALGQAGLKQTSRKGLAALVLAANMPDIDVIFGHSCWVPLATHRGVTHSLVGGMIVMPPMLAALLWLLDRWQQARGVRFRSGLSMDFGWLLALCYFGAITHPLLDWQTSYAVQLLSPFSNRWFHAESLFIIDGFVWLSLGLAIWLSRRREKRGGAWRRPALAALTAVLAYIGFNQVLTSQAKAALRASPPYPKPDAVYARFAPLRFWYRGLVWRENGRIGSAEWTPSAGLRHVSEPAPDNMGEPLVRSTMFATRDLRRFMRWSTMPFARVQREKCQATVTFNDARYGVINFPWPRKSPFLHQVTVPLAEKDCE